MAYFRFRRVEDDKIKIYKTRGLEVIENDYRLILPVWDKVGNRISIPVIQEYGWVLEYVPDQSEERIAYEKYTYFYVVEPSLHEKVVAVRDIYDDLGVEYNCTADEQAAALEAKYPDPTDALRISKDLADKSEAAAKVMVDAYHSYLKNVEKDDDANPVGVWSFYNEFPYLVRWLPGTYAESDIPEKLLPIIVTNEETFEELKETL